LLSCSRTEERAVIRHKQSLCG